MKTNNFVIMLSLLMVAGCSDNEKPYSGESLEVSSLNDSHNGWGGINPGSPEKSLKIVFLHHSCGKNLLDDGLRDKLKENNYQITSITYGDEWFGDHTDPPDFPITFDKYIDKILTWKLPENQRYNIVMFKSCYPASAIKSDELLQQYKEWYKSLVSVFKKHDNILFIPFSPPPLHPKATNKDEALRAHRFANWLKKEYSLYSNNIASFDFFNFLGDPNQHTLRFKYRRTESETLKRLSFFRRIKTKARKNE